MKKGRDIKGEEEEKKGNNQDGEKKGKEQGQRQKIRQRKPKENAQIKRIERKGIN